jgi:UDP-glucose 4-epimerase
VGHEVFVVDDLSGGFVENLPPGAHFVKGSILDHQMIDRLFEKSRFEYVYHLAAYAAEGLSHFIKRFNYENNLIGTVNLINASLNHGVHHFVFTSSIAVYGAGQAPLTEALVPVPEDPYGVAKLACEQELRVTQRMFGLNYTVFRPHNVYGEKQNIGDRYRNVVGIFMNQILKNEPMTVFGDGEQQRAFTYVGDVAPLIAQSVSIPLARNETFNVGADLPVTVNELARRVAAAMGVECRVVHLDPRNEVRFAFADHRKAERAFPRQQRTPLDEGIRRMAAWVRAHGSRASNTFEGIEVARKLPPSWAADAAATPSVPAEPASPGAAPEGRRDATPQR